MTNNGSIPFPTFDPHLRQGAARARLPAMLAATALLAACGGDGATDPTATATRVDVDEAASSSSPPPLVVPTSFAGNFVPSSAAENQICYDMFRDDITGYELKEFKVDPPAAFSEGDVSVTLSPDGRQLSWLTSGGSRLWGVVVKGGNAYNLYRYQGETWSPAYPASDSQLEAPRVVQRNGKTIVPQISHYNVCYQPPPPSGLQGCTRGYWANHADRWLGVAPGNDFDTVFGVDAFTTNRTLGQAITAGGGGIEQLAAQATAALLNAYGGVSNALDGVTVQYPYSAAQVIGIVQTAVGTLDNPATLAVNEAAVAIEAAKNALDTRNNLGCPLSGTKAVSVTN